MARIPWILTDPVAAEAYAFPVNPREGGAPSYRKGITTKTTSASGDERRVLLFEGADEPVGFDASGTLLDKAQFDALKLWYQKRVILTLEDDLDNVYAIYLTSLDFKRAPKSSHPWRHTFSFTSVVVQ